MKSLLATLATLVLVIPAVSLHVNPALQNSATQAASEALKPLPELRLTDFDGKTVGADALKGNIVVLDFWATWCLPCIGEIPLLNGIQQKYQDKGLKVIGVTMASGDPSEVKPFIAKNRMQYTVLMGDDNQANDFIMAFPTTYLITRDLKVYQKYVGSGPRKEAALNGDIQKLIQSGN
jgi:thiol-disulfide isomerase/thioredoxin